MEQAIFVLNQPSHEKQLIVFMKKNWTLLNGAILSEKNDKGGKL